jgi:hypothetical protein
MGWLIALIRWLVRLVVGLLGAILGLLGYSEALRIYPSRARPLYLAWPSKALRASRKPAFRSFFSSIQWNSESILSRKPV